MAGTRKFDLVGFDVDGTLVDDTVFVWLTLHEFFGTPREARDIAFDHYMAGRWTYQQWFEHDIEVLLAAGADQESMGRALQGMKLIPGALDTLAALRQAGVILVIISGSLNLVTDRFQLHRYFDEMYLNHLGFDKAGRLVEWRATPYDVWDKATGLRHVAKRYGVPMERTAYVGDNFNDVAVARAAGFSIAFNCKSDELAEVADEVILEKDLRLVLRHLLSDGS